MDAGDALTCAALPGPVFISNPALSLKAVKSHHDASVKDAICSGLAAPYALPALAWLRSHKHEMLAKSKAQERR